MILGTLAGHSMKKPLIESFVMQILHAVTHLCIYDIDEQQSLDDDYYDCTSRSLDDICFNYKDIDKAMSFAKSDGMFKKVFASKSTIEAVLLGIWSMHATSQEDSNCKKLFSHRYCSVFGDTSSFYDGRKLRARDRLMSEVFNCINKADSKMLRDWHMGEDNLLVSMCSAASIDSRYKMLEQFTDCCAPEGEKTYDKLKLAFGKTFATLMKSGVSPYEHTAGSKSFADIVGQHTIAKLLAEKFDDEEEY